MQWVTLPSGRARCVLNMPTPGVGPPATSPGAPLYVPLRSADERVNPPRHTQRTVWDPTPSSCGLDDHRELPTTRTDDAFGFTHAAIPDTFMPDPMRDGAYRCATLRTRVPACLTTAPAIAVTAIPPGPMNRFGLEDTASKRHQASRPSIDEGDMKVKGVSAGEW